jgi:hypothetical protein
MACVEKAVKFGLDRHLVIALEAALRQTFPDNVRPN